MLSPKDSALGKQLSQYVCVRIVRMDDVDVGRGLHFDGADHALDAVVEGAGVLLAHSVLAYDDLRTGRLVIPVGLTLPSNRAYHLACLKERREHPKVRAFSTWIRQEIAQLDWARCANCHPAV